MSKISKPKIFFSRNEPGLPSYGYMPWVCMDNICIGRGWSPSDAWLDWFKGRPEAILDIERIDRAIEARKARLQRAADAFRGGLDSVPETPPPYGVRAIKSFIEKVKSWTSL